MPLFLRIFSQTLSDLCATPPACSKPGTYAPDAKSATCKLCPKGFQCPTNAMRLQGPCPRGTFSNKEGNRLCTPW